MGRQLSPRPLLAGAVAASWLMALCAAAQAGSITFLTPREVMLRHNGAPVRGAVKSMTSDEVVMVLKTGVEKSFSMSGVTSIAAADNSFKYFPAQETFDQFLAKSASVRGVTIVRDEAPQGSSTGGAPKTIPSVSDGYARMIGMQPAARPKINSSSGGFAESGGFAGASQRPKGLMKLDSPTIPELDPSAVAAMEREKKAAEIAAATPAAPPAYNGAYAPAPGARQEVLICSNPACGKEVPGAKYGDKCPHCGLVWSQQSTGDVVAASSNGSAPLPIDPKDPFARAIPQQAATPAGTPPTPVAAAPGVPAAGATQGFSLETLPWWGKLIGFGASIMVLLFIMGRR